MALTLTPTNITIDGKRVWLEGRAETDAQRKELEAAMASVEYKSGAGISLHVQRNAKLPKRDRIVKETTDEQ